MNLRVVRGRRGPGNEAARSTSLGLYSFRTYLMLRLANVFTNLNVPELFHFLLNILDSNNLDLPADLRVLVGLERSVRLKVP